MQKSKIEVIIADEDESFLKNLESYTDLIGEISIVGKVQNGLDLVDMITTKEPKLAIIDINLSGITGFDAILKGLELQPNINKFMEK